MERISLSGLLREKFTIKEKLASMLDRKERRDALNDGHAHREPRPCGLTVHPGRGCTFGCIYCYIGDMGISEPPKPSKLNGLQLAYAIASNPYTLLGRNGTFLALGSVTEPFLPSIKGRTIEYLEAISRYLENPAQFSTKAYLDMEEAELIYSIDPSVSALVTIPTLRWASKLEPMAPSPDLRFETIENLLSAGIDTALFMRPLIPGISEQDGPEILRRAAELGVRGVILGSLRVTRRILMALERLGLEDISQRMVREPRSPSDQVPIMVSDLKRMLSSLARKLGMKVFPSACSANVHSHSLGCHMCNMGPCGDPPPEYDLEEMEAALRQIGIETRIIPKGARKIIVLVKGGSKRAKRAKHLVSAATKRMVKVKSVGDLK